jgi:Reverse transcriptase (RNA-dependent DNA polymerase)/GAG-pre-integrase domain
MMIFELHIAHNIMIFIVIVQCYNYMVSGNKTIGDPRQSYKVHNDWYVYFQWFVISSVICILEFAIANIGKCSKKSTQYSKHSRWKFHNRLIVSTIIWGSNQRSKVVKGYEYKVHVRPTEYRSYTAEHGSAGSYHISRNLPNDIICNATYDQEAHRIRKTRFDTDSYPIKIDNCCTTTMSGYKHDFEPSTFQPVINKVVRGFGNTLTPITHTGTVVWSIDDDQGNTHQLRIPNAYYVPESGIRLLSPQHWAQMMIDNSPHPNGTWCGTYEDRIVLHWDQQKYIKTIHLDRTSNNVATMWTTPDVQGYQSFVNEMETSCTSEYAYPSEIQKEEVVKEDEFQIEEQHPTIRLETSSIPCVDDNVIFDEEKCVYAKTPSSSEELLKWHRRYGHMSMKRIQRMATQGILPKHLATCPLPICQSCLFGKMSRKAWRQKGDISSQIGQGVVRSGQCVSVDQLESPHPGIIAQMKGVPTRERYTTATVFIDHHSDFTFVYLQRTTSAVDTLAAKHEFERCARSMGVCIERYHSDNGRFAENLWQQDLRLQRQYGSYCGVNAHHQNGKIEKRIRDLQDNARASLLYASLQWPDAINMYLWPYAVRKVATDMNKSFNLHHQESPLERFSSVPVLPNPSTSHPFGCPMYVLHNVLQQGHKISKWDARSRMAIYIGPSLNHAANVGLALSLSTGLVSPVFHARYDDNFVTVQQRFGEYLPKSYWQVKCGFRSDPALGAIRDVVPDIPLPPNTQPSPDATDVTDSAPSNGDDDHSHSPQVSPREVSMADQREDPREAQREAARAPNTITSKVPATSSSLPRTTRSGRQVKLPKRYAEYDMYDTAVLCSACLEPAIEYSDPIAFATSSDPDIMYYHEISSQPDKDEFLKAMDVEITSMNKHQHWRLVRRSSIPPNTKVLPTVWAMRRKRRLTTGEIYKWKARLNIDGSKQTYGINYWDTYAPVATWISIRLILCMAALNNWATMTMDFVQAYPQAPAEVALFVSIPNGCIVDGDEKSWCLEVLNNIYGQKQAGKVWNDFLITGLLELGFVQSRWDPCVLWKGSYILVIYTDDTIITGPNPVAIKQLIADIGTRFEITSAEIVDDFLGVNICRQPDGTIHLTQPQLIQTILRDLGLTAQSNSRPIPAIANVVLHAHVDSPPHNEAWHYRSIIGKLNFLEKSSRPDIAYAVHQCARFSENPRIEHTKAVKAIGRYLLSTKTRGLIFSPATKGLECFADAGFAGSWCPSTAEHDPSTARSRSGFVIKYANCPIFWASKMQTEVALSSTESEYIALSQSLRDVIPLIAFIRELSQAGFTFDTSTPIAKCTAFEDNNGALEMARSPKMRPRTKHINIKYHHFREAVRNGDITLQKISTHDQEADIFTKPLIERTFLYLRRKIMGW